MAVIGLIAALLLPALGTGAGRSVDGASRQFAADLERARLMAMAERTRTRVLLPSSSANFTVAASPAPYPSAPALHSYLITSARRTDSTWKQRSRWGQLPSGVAFDPSSSAFISPTPTPPPPAAMAIDPAGTGTTKYTYSGPYIEFLANGSSNLDPAASPRVISVADAFVNAAGTFIPKNKKLKSTITVDPLSGSVTLK